MSCASKRNRNRSLDIVIPSETFLFIFTNTSWYKYIYILVWLTKLPKPLVVRIEDVQKGILWTSSQTHLFYLFKSQRPSLYRTYVRGQQQMKCKNVILWKKTTFDKVSQKLLPLASDKLHTPKSICLMSQNLRNLISFVVYSIVCSHAAAGGTEGQANDAQAVIAILRNKRNLEL